MKEHWLQTQRFRRKLGIAVLGLLVLADVTCVLAYVFGGRDAISEHMLWGLAGQHLICIALVPGLFMNRQKNKDKASVNG
ncbi:MAG TPA: hypothetical protein VHE12_01740 [bacterium]|nr:hypothetical protein [bacterium]